MNPAKDGLFGGYRVGEILGAGSTSRVFSAVAPDGRRVALKVFEFHRNLPPDEGVLQRFVNEIGRVTKLRHASIVDVYDSG